MSRFNWWRRYSKKPKLSKKDAFKGKTFLLQQIEHGDFDHSDYLRQAREELLRMKDEQQEITDKHKGGKESLQEKLDECERKYRKRYNKLMQDYEDEEVRTIQLLKESLIKQFGADVWDMALEQNTDTLVEFYWKYQQLTKEIKK